MDLGRPSKPHTRSAAPAPRPRGCRRRDGGADPSGRAPPGGPASPRGSGAHGGAHVDLSGSHYGTLDTCQRWNVSSCAGSSRPPPELRGAALPGPTGLPYSRRARAALCDTVPLADVPDAGPAPGRARLARSDIPLSEAPRALHGPFLPGSRLERQADRLPGRWPRVGLHKLRDTDPTRRFRRLPLERQAGEGGPAASPGWLRAPFLARARGGSAAPFGRVPAL